MSKSILGQKWFMRCTLVAITVLVISGLIFSQSQVANAAPDHHNRKPGVAVINPTKNSEVNIPIPIEIIALSLRGGGINQVEMKVGLSPFNPMSCTPSLPSHLVNCTAVINSFTPIVQGNNFVVPIIVKATTTNGVSNSVHFKLVAHLGDTQYRVLGQLFAPGI